MGESRKYLCLSFTLSISCRYECPVLLSCVFAASLSSIFNMQKDRDTVENSYESYMEHQANVSAQWKTRRDTFFGIGLSLFAGRFRQMVHVRQLVTILRPVNTTLMRKNCPHHCLKSKRALCERVGLEISNLPTFEGGRKS